MGTKALRAPDGTIYDVPEEEVGSAIADGYRDVDVLIAPDGSEYDVPVDQVDAAIADGYRRPGATQEPAMATPEPAEEPAPTLPAAAEPAQSPASEEQPGFFERAYDVAKEAVTPFGAYSPTRYVAERLFGDREAAAPERAARATVEGLAQGAALDTRAPVAAAQATGQYLRDAVTPGVQADFGRAYEEAQQGIQARAEGFPVLSGAGRVGGGIASAIATGGLGTARLATSLAARLAPIGVGATQKLAAGAVALALEAGAQGSAMKAASEVDDAILKNDYEGLAERTLAAARDGFKEGTLIGLGVGAAGKTLGILGSAVGKALPSAADFASGRAFKAVLQQTSKKGVKLSQRHGGPAAVGRTMLDEGIVTKGATFEEIGERAAAKRNELGAELGALVKQVDELAGGAGPTKEGLRDAIFERVINPLKKPGTRDLAEKLERALDDMGILVPLTPAQQLRPQAWRGPAVAGQAADAAPVVSDPWRTVAGQAADQRVVGSGLMGSQTLPATAPQLVPAVGQRSVVGSGLMGSAADDASLRGVIGGAGEGAAQQLGPRVGAAAGVDSGLMGSPRPDAISFQELNDLRKTLDKRLRWETPTGDVLLEAKRDVRRVVDQYWLDAAEEAAKKSGVEGIPGQVKQLKRRFAHVALADDLASDAAEGRLARRFISPSDYGVGGAALAGSLATGGMSVGAAATGLAGAVSNKLLRERSNQVVAATLDQLVKGATKAQARLNSAASLKGLIKATPAITSGVEASELRAGQSLSPVMADDGQIETEIERAAQLADQDSEASHTMGAFLQEVELEAGPEMAEALRQKELARAAFLVEKAGPEPEPGVFSGTPKRVLDDETKASLRRYIDAADHPERALERVGNGTATEEDYETLRALYPQMLQDFRGKALGTLSELKTAPEYDQQLVISAALGVPLTPDADPASRAYWQELAAAGAALGQQEDEQEAQKASQKGSPERFKVAAEGVRSKASRIG